MQNLLCAAQGAAVLVGLAANGVVGAWWLDPVVALGLAAFAVREGRETWNSEGCCVREWGRMSYAATTAAPSWGIVRWVRTTPTAVTTVKI